MFPLRGWFYYGLGFDAFEGKSPSGECEIFPRAFDRYRAIGGSVFDSKNDRFDYQSSEIGTLGDEFLSRTWTINAEIIDYYPGIGS